MTICKHRPTMRKVAMTQKLMRTANDEHRNGKQRFGQYGATSGACPGLAIDRDAGSLGAKGAVRAAAPRRGKKA